jgi:hypothetical protein
MNPFLGYGVVVQGSRLVGRDGELAYLKDRLSCPGSSLSIIGEPRIGKSSLVAQAVSKFRLDNSSVPVVWLDVSTLPDSVELFQAILGDILDGCELEPQDRRELEIVQATAVATSYEAYRQCRRGLMRLNRLGVRSILVLDEFDDVRRFPDASTTVQRLRDLIYKPHETGLSAVFISRRSLRAIEQQVADVSTLDNVCEQASVRPLDDVGLTALFARCGGEWELSVALRDIVRYHTGGHPYLTEMILCHAWGTKSVEDGVAGSIAAIFEYYEHLRRLLTEDALFDQLLQLVVGPRWSLKTGAPEQIMRYGLVKTNAEGYRGWSDHFQSYLEKCAREANVWELWRTTEDGLRGLIVDTYSQALGNDWVNILSKKFKTVAATFDGCRGRMEREAKNFGSSASVRILDFSYPMDLSAIVFAEWELFRPVFGKDKKYWNDRFTHLSKIRTPSAHNREAVIPEPEMILAQAYCKEMLFLFRRAVAEGDSVVA